MRGHTVIEAVIALAVITIVASAVLVGEGAQLRGVKQSFDELAASRAAAGRLDELSLPGAKLATGETLFPVDLPGAHGVQRVRRLEEGLFEVTVVVHGAQGKFELTSLIAEERG